MENTMKRKVRDMFLSPGDFSKTISIFYFSTEVDPDQDKKIQARINIANTLTACI